MPPPYPPGTNSLPPGGTLIIDQTPIIGGTNTYVLYDNNGVVGVEPAGSVALTVGVTPISGGTAGYVLTDNGGTLEEMPASDLSFAFYVNGSTGSDTNTGLSPGAAWQTISKVNASTFSPGAAVLFAGGQTFSGAIVSPNAGTAAQPITFGSYGGGQATISSGNSNGFTSTNQAGIIVRDLTFTGSASTNHGILFQNTLAIGGRLPKIQAMNCNVSSYGRNGIFATGSVNGAGYDDIQFQGCTVNGCNTVAFSGNGTAGIIVQNVASFGLGSNPVSFNNVVISGCISHDNTGCSDTNWTGSGIFVGQAGNWRISYCSAYSNGASGVNSLGGGGPAGIWASDFNTGLINDCTCHDQGTGTTADGGGFSLDEGSINGTIRDCYAHDNAGPGFEIFSGADAGVTGNDRCSILNCVSENDGKGASNTNPVGISIGGDNATSTNYRVSGCTVYQSNATTRAFGINGSHAAAVTGLVDANRFVVTGSQPFVYTTANPSSVTFAGNDYISEGVFNVTWNSVGYTSLVAWRLATGQETNSVLNLSTFIGDTVLPPNANFVVKAAGPGLILLDTQSNGNTWNTFGGVTGTTAYFGLYSANSPDQTLMALNFDAHHSLQIQRDAVFGWSNNARYADAAAMDTGISRTGAGQVAIGNGTPGDFSGTLTLKELFIETTHPVFFLNDIEANGHQWQIFGQVIGTQASFGLFDNTSSVTVFVFNYDGHDSFQTISGAVHGWSSNSQFADGAAMDTGISRTGAAAIAFGNGTQGDASATINAAAYKVGGTAGISATITTAKLTPATGANGSMTFVNGILTAQTQAT